MALTKADKDYIAAAIVAGITTALAEIARPAVAAPTKAAPVAEHIGPSGKPDGRKFPCKLGCAYIARSEASAESHDPADGKWHTETSQAEWVARMSRKVK